MRVGPYCAVALAIALSGACTGGTRATHIAMPPRSASPATVVRTYLLALNAHDRSTAEKLLAPGHRTVVEREVDSPLTDVRGITHIQIGTVSRQAGQGPYAHWDIVDVVVHFDLSQYHSESMPNGPTDWGYLVGRAQPSDPWRIVDEGVG